MPASRLLGQGFVWNASTLSSVSCVLLYDEADLEKLSEADWLQEVDAKNPKAGRMAVVDNQKAPWWDVPFTHEFTRFSVLPAAHVTLWTHSHQSDLMGTFGDRLSELLARAYVDKDTSKPVWLDMEEPPAMLQIFTEVTPGCATAIYIREI